MGERLLTFQPHGDPQGACKVMIVRGLLTLVLVRGVGLTDCRRGPGFALRYGRVVMALG